MSSGSEAQHAVATGHDDVLPPQIGAPSSGPPWKRSPSISMTSRAAGYAKSTRASSEPVVTSGRAIGGTGGESVAVDESANSVSRRSRGTGSPRRAEIARRTRALPRRRRSHRSSSCREPVERHEPAAEHVVERERASAVSRRRRQGRGSCEVGSVTGMPSTSVAGRSSRRTLSCQTTSDLLRRRWRRAVTSTTSRRDPHEVPQRRGRSVRGNRRAHEARCHQALLPRVRRLCRSVDAVVDADPLGSAYAAIDLAGREADVDRLAAREHAVLPPCKVTEHHGSVRGRHVGC